MKNLEKFGVETLKTQEMREIDGGNPLRWLGGVIIEGLVFEGVKWLFENGEFTVTDGGYAGSKV